MCDVTLFFNHMILDIDVCRVGMEKDLNWFLFLFFAIQAMGNKGERNSKLGAYRGRLRRKEKTDVSFGSQ